MINNIIQDKLKNLPEEPGVYMMRDEVDQVIYVGKAKNLKKRVRQYFGSYGKKDKKVEAMVSHIKDFEYIIVQNELESLILESNLIKEYHPKYNILLRDDKQYPYIKVTVNESFPRVMKTRKTMKDGAKYYGPYPNVLAVNEAIEIFHEVYPIRNCKLDLDKNRGNIRPCLNYFIKRCIGPCLGTIDKEDYLPYINDILLFLDGKEEKLIQLLEEKMLKASQDLEYERAAEYRDKIQALKTLTEKQLITDAASSEEYDMINLARGEGYVCIQIFFIRQGKIMGREHFILEDPYKESESDILQAFISQFFHGTAFIPTKIYVPVEIEELVLLEKMLTKKKGAKVNILIPYRGEKSKMLSLVKKNAIDMLVKHSDSYQQKRKKQEMVLKDLQELLKLKEFPSRIEAFDISNISGVESVGSMVVYEDGKAKKSDYRRFRIKSVQGPDDYGSLREVLSRRFMRGLDEKNERQKLTSFSFFPDLILMDGGKGQVNIATSVLRDLGIQIPIAGLVKDDFHKTRGIIYEGQELQVKKDSGIYRLVYQIQEEAHRFAINYHRNLRSKSVFRSELDDIPMIGEKRKKELMKYFQSLEKIKKATIEELSQVNSMNKIAAESLYRHFHGGKDGQ